MKIKDTFCSHILSDITTLDVINESNKSKGLTNIDSMNERTSKTNKAYCFIKYWKILLKFKIIEYVKATF
jgi:hypothetical protein